MAQAQITNGGPIILFQPENEYSLVRNNQLFPDGTYMQYVINQAHDNGILVPIISNDAHPSGHNAPGTGLGEVDIYGYDAYPLGFNCARPEDWPTGKLPTNWADLHLQQSPNTPFSILEFQGGSYDVWGGNGYEKCAELLNQEFTRVFNKNNIAFGINILNMYMAFGGTNWGNLGYPRGYTSYDYGATIAEDRTITRKKYGEAKLLGYFFSSVPAYREAVPRRATTALTTTADLTVTPLSANETGFWVLRHTDYSQRKKTEYEITLPTRAGNMTIPQLAGKLTLNGRDSKILTTDLQLSGNTHLRYSSAEILAITETDGRRVLVLYGRADERHECAIDIPRNAKIYEHRQGVESSIKTKRQGGSLVVAWDAAKERSIVDLGSTRLVLLGNDSAYDYWVVDLQTTGPKQKIIIKGPYLVRSVRVQGNRLDISADFNQTTTVEVFAVPAQVKNLFINSKKSKHSEPIKGVWSTNVSFETPRISLPDFSTSSWKFIDSLPEVKPEYDDAGWPKADLRDSHNDYRALSTPTSLYSGDYGFHAGLLIYRGHFVSSGNETGLEIWNQGGWAFSSSAWLNGTYLGSSKVNATRPDANTTYEFPRLDQGRRYTLTILQDSQGYELNPWVGDDEMKHPRGILNYTLQQREQESISWRISGNLGGEDYQDRVRGPLNEGGSFVERNGFHQPGPPTKERSWTFLYGDDAASFELQSEAYGMLERVKEDLEHWRAKGPVGKLHNIVRFIRASPQRTEAFKAHAKEQEEADIYKLAEESTAELEVIQNNATRWNSTYMMIERALIKQSELNSFIQELGLEADASRRVPTADILTSDD
ncbi:Beta-galactosidase [Fusarium keratoplasticum]|uniref:Beta-galactosidase n=1 Tax=Fusarium keratoplasticum TaxID=1328300 RepID=A0ACC0RB90_9HYPO|nr:Beta-galactosidase [Fusarium keratoplasticum]KAI8683376.1 Beta-galactosidase [Fusarium keratoplasticum]